MTSSTKSPDSVWIMSLYNPDTDEVGTVIEMSGAGAVLQTLPRLPDRCAVSTTR